MRLKIRFDVESWKVFLILGGSKQGLLLLVVYSSKILILQFLATETTSIVEYSGRCMAQAMLAVGPWPTALFYTEIKKI